VKERVLLAVLGDEGAATLLPDDEVLYRHLVERLAYRALADAELGGEPPLARQDFPRPPIAAHHAADHQLLDLCVERAEVGSVGGRRQAIILVHHSYIRHKNSVDKR